MKRQGTAHFPLMMIIKKLFYSFKNAEGLGEQRVSTFSSQMPALNGCPHFLRCEVPQLESHRGKKQEFQGSQPMELLLYTSVCLSKA